MWQQMGGFGAMGGGMGAGMILFWGLVIFVILAAVLFGARGWPRGGREKTPLETLKERYARGEIQRDEFEQKKHDLGG